MPVPVRETICVVPATPPESSVIVSVAASAAVVEGVNVTLITQEFPGPGAGGTAVLFLQVVVPATMAKSVASAPLIATAFDAARFSVSLPLLVSVAVSAALVTPFGWLPKANVGGAAPPCGDTPVPVNETACVVPATPPESSVIVNVAASAPVVEGVNVTLITQELPGPGAGETVVLFLQVVVPATMAKSPAFAPLITTAFAAAKFSVSVPVFVNVTVKAALVVPFRWLPNASGLGAADACGSVPVPVSVTVCVVPAVPLESSVTVTFAACAPVAVGANFTLNLQLLAAATAVPAAIEQAVPELGAPSTNCVGFVPPSAMLAMLSVSVPVLLTVTSVPALVVPFR